MSFRLRDLPAYPILALLHLLFTITSLIVRIGESLTSSRTLARAAKPPGHIALVLSDRSDVETTRSTRTKRDENAGERRAVVESIRRVVEWADYAGTDEVSVWDRRGKSRYGSVYSGLTTRLDTEVQTGYPQRGAKASALTTLIRCVYAYSA